MSDTLVLHIVAERLPDQLVTKMISGEQIPSPAESDDTHDYHLPAFGDAHIQIVVHWQPNDTPVKAIERATLNEVLDHMVADSAMMAGLIADDLARGATRQEATPEHAEATPETV